MKKLTLIAIWLLIPRFAFAQNFEKFIGTWVDSYAGQDVHLIVKPKDNFIAIEIPGTEYWRVEIKNVRWEDEKLKFEQTYYRKDGGHDPANGTVTYCEMGQDSDGYMRLRHSQKKNDGRCRSFYNPQILSHDQ